MKKIQLITFFCLTILILPLHAQVVSTFAGSGSQGSTNGTGTTARFYFPTGVAVDASGNVLQIKEIILSVRLRPQE